MTNVAATLNDLRHVAENGKAELVKGELVPIPPAGGLPGYAAGEIFASLREYAQRTRTGYAFADNVGFIVDLPERQSFSPDAAFYTGELTMKFLKGAPVLAVEVRSESDYGSTAEQEMAQKRADYFAAGTLVVWDVNLVGDAVVRSYNAIDPDEPIVYRRGESAAAEPAVPGWTLAVDRLFPD